MTTEGRIQAKRITDEAGRNATLLLLAATYQKEKGRITEPNSQFPSWHLELPNLSWYMVWLDREPVGVLRILYDPPLLEYAKYELKLLDSGLEIGAFLAHKRIVEVGRFAVLAAHRGNLLLATALMRAAMEEILARGYTHIITDVFEDDTHSPLGFHTRVIGFVPVATHEHGELNCQSRRITLLLDLKSSYHRLKARGNWVYRYLTANWPENLHRCLAA
jgi:ribosomal protein S18 acetylase RimI-like enzyme